MAQQSSPRNRVYQTSPVNMLFVTLILLLSVSYSHTQGPLGLLATNCWFSAPSVDEATINVQIVTTNSTSDGSKMWNISAVLTWSRPTELGVASDGGVYVVKLNQIPSFSEPSICKIGVDEVVVRTGEEYTFHNLEFGFLYEFTVYVYNLTKTSKALMGSTRAFGTPDCFQATGDRRFCSSEEIEYAGAPIEPTLTHLCQNDTWVRATVSWLPPIQYNGDLIYYGVQHAELGPRGLILSETAYIEPKKNTEDGRVYYTISDLMQGMAYLITITPHVTTSSNGSTNAGLGVEMTFIADHWQGPETSSPSTLTDASSVAETSLPFCPPDLVTKAMTTEPPTTTPTMMTSSSSSSSSANFITSAIFDKGGLVPPSPYLNDLAAVNTSPELPPQKPLTVTVRVLIKESNGNKSIAVVTSLLLCAIILGLFWLGMKIFNRTRPNAKKSSSVVVTDTGNTKAGNIVPDVITDKPAVGNKV